MPEVGGPDRWPDWCMGEQPTNPASDPRLRVVTMFHFEADLFAEAAAAYARIPMEVWRDRRGRWSISPKEHSL